MLNVTISGSFRKFPRALQRDIDEFRDAGAVVLSPPSAQIIDVVRGFATLRGDPVEGLSHLSEGRLSGAFRVIENHHLSAIANSDLLWLTMPDGYCGNSTSLEIGCAVTHNVPVYARLEDVLKTREPIVLEYVNPVPSIPDAISAAPRRFSQSRIDRLHLQSTETVRSIANPAVAVGAIIFKAGEHGAKDQLLTVRTYKWGGRYSIVGARISEGENPQQAVLAAVKEQTGLDCRIRSLVSVDTMIPGSGYYNPDATRLWVDFLVETSSQRVHLDQRADRFEWGPLEQLLQLDIEPNARMTMEQLPHCP